LINLQDTKNAYERIKNIIVNTPFSYAPKLSAISNSNIFLKKENLQLTGAFKLRGAFNKIVSLSDEERLKGVIAASAGNHAQGVAYSAKHFGIKAVIVMPESTPLTKINGVKSYGAEVILAGGNYDEAYAYAKDYGSKHQLSFVHPFTDAKVIAGQGTIALEILEKNKNIDAIIVPVGGGGLISGIAKTIKEINPNISIIGVSAKGAPALKESYKAKKVIDSVNVKTIADGIAVRDSSSITLEYILQYVDQFISVDDEEIASAILFLLEQQKLVVEGAGAVGVAALLHNKIDTKKYKNIAIVLSGGNIDVTMLNLIIEKGLIKSNRKLKIKITLVDKPGSLMRLTQILQNLYANIVQIGYDRTSTKLDFGDADVTLAVETKGDEHQEQILSKLYSEGYKFQKIV